MMAPQNTTTDQIGDNDANTYPAQLDEPVLNDQPQHQQPPKDFCEQGIKQKRKTLSKKSLSFDGMNLMLLKKGMKLLWKMPKSVRLDTCVAIKRYASEIVW